MGKNFAGDRSNQGEVSAPDLRRHRSHVRVRDLQHPRFPPSARDTAAARAVLSTATARRENADADRPAGCLARARRCVPPRTRASVLAPDDAPSAAGRDTRRPTAHRPSPRDAASGIRASSHAASGTCSGNDGVAVFEDHVMRKGRISLHQLADEARPGRDAPHIGVDVERLPLVHQVPFLESISIHAAQGGPAWQWHTCSSIDRLPFNATRSILMA
jgi:hypothetical protein